MDRQQQNQPSIYQNTIQPNPMAFVLGVRDFFFPMILTPRLRNFSL